MVNTRRQARLKKTAYHEAGHAVVSHRMYRKFRKVTVEPGEDFLGQIIHRKWDKRLDPEWDLNPVTVERLESLIIISWAGIEAEKRFTGGRYDYRGAQRDIENANTLCLYLAPGIGEIYRLQMRLLRLRARGWVEISHVWAQIETIAQALLQERTLTYDRVIEILYGPHVRPRRTDES